MILFLILLECLPSNSFYLIEAGMFVDHFVVVLKYLQLFNSFLGITTLKSFIYYVIGIITWFLFNNFSIGTYGTLVLVDFVTKFNLNDAFVSSLYIMWVFLYYLATFFFSLAFLHLYLRYSITCFINLVYILPLILIYLSYVVELFDFVSFNFNLTTSVIPDMGINILLTNMLNRYHPFIFYYSVIVITTRLLILTFLKNRTVSYRLLSLKTEILVRSIFWTLVLNFLALYLGAWWANQEGNWGGWWASDSSEMLGMLTLTLSLIFLHAKIVASEHGRHLTWGIVFLNTSFVFYYFLQINYELVSHNFGAKFFFFFNNNLWSAAVILWSLLCLQRINKRYYTARVVLCGYLWPFVVGSVKFFNNLTYTLFTFLCFWLILSIAPLVDNFVLTYKHEWGVLFSEIYLFIRISFILILLSVFVNISRYWLFDIVFLVWFNTPGLAILTFHNFNFLNLLKQIHWLLICFLCINLYTDALLFLYPNRLSGAASFIVCNNTYYAQSLVYVCDGCWFNQCTVLIDKLFTLFNTQTILTHSNSFEYDKLNLLFNSSIMFNCLHLSVCYNHLFSFIEFSEDYVLNIIILIVFLKTVVCKAKNKYHIFY